jgi:predicted transport protein
MIDGKTRTIKSKSVPVVKFAIRGKTLNAYLALNPQEFIDTKYIFTNVSNVKKYANYPMRVKITSDRQAKWTIELLEKLFNKNDLMRGKKND